MIEIITVTTKKQQKAFLDFPLKLYKGNPYFVPPLYGDEKKIFSKDFAYADTCETEYFLAYKDGKLAGRISVILQKAYNEKTSQKRVRFTRFDCIDDKEVAKCLFDAIENWAKQKNMDTVCGPLGFSDLEREGLLIEGFKYLATFEEQYNYSYYQGLIEHCGYTKDVDWVECRLFVPKEDGNKMRLLSNAMLKKYNLHVGQSKNTNDFINKYGEQFFELLDKTYVDIYGTVPLPEKAKKELLNNFKLLINKKHVAVILDQDEKVVCFGLCFPSIAPALKKSSGKLTLPTLIKLLFAIKRPKSLDLELIGVDPKYANKGISTAIIAELQDYLNSPEIEFAETNLNLEDNYPIRNMWKNFDSIQHKRRRSFIKKIDQ